MRSFKEVPLRAIVKVAKNLARAVKTAPADNSSGVVGEKDDGQEPKGRQTPPNGVHPPRDSFITEARRVVGLNEGGTNNGESLRKENQN